MSASEADAVHNVTINFSVVTAVHLWQLVSDDSICVIIVRHSVITTANVPMKL